MKYTKSNVNSLVPKRNGWYYFTIDGKEVKYPSITNILGVADKSRFLVPWAAKDCAARAAKEPWKTEDEIYSEHRQECVISAGTRGKGVHNLASEILHSRPISEQIKAKYERYLTPLSTFIKEHKPKEVFNEKVVRSDKYGIGGTTDWLLDIGGKKWLVDIKTSKSVYPAFFLQLGFYEQALSEEGISIDKCVVLHLPGNGKYSIIQGQGDMGVVEGLKQYYLWSENNK